MFQRAEFTLAQWQCFVAAAETGSISAAAGELHMSQSALSSAIQRLEKQLGTALFIRHHARGITLSSAGEQLLDKARNLLRDAAELADAGRNLRHGVNGELRIGCFVTLAPFYVPPVLTGLRERHPELRVDVLESDGAGLAAALRSARCDIALGYGLEVPEDIRFRHLLSVRPYALVATRHPAAGSDSASLRELARTPMVLLDLPETGRFILGMLEHAGVPIPEIVRTTNFETMRGLVASTGGFAILNQRTRPAEGSRAVHITDAEPVSIGMLYAGGVPANRRMAAFTEQCRKVAGELRSG
ncbi:LysR family transcriptional regulator [Sciscionella marina]|uniref:LysR family transcriptional regulator n=1 Tax=Sciscionella marina TaxID=508770 RepID=UPI0003745434|nr:LysR family transcriptional regulator [Sciscionella marina]